VDLDEMVASGAVPGVDVAEGPPARPPGERLAFVVWCLWRGAVRVALAHLWPGR
jgi:hypothetical protein